MTEPEADGDQAAAAPAEASRRPRPMETFRIPFYGRYWVTNLLQFFSFNMQLLAKQWLITDLTPSRTLLGLVGFIQGSMGVVSSPIAGVIVDRVSKRDLMRVGRSLLALVVLAVAALVWTDRIEIWHIMVMSVLAGLIMSLMQPATQTYVFDIVGRDRVQNAVALNSAGTGVAQMAGPALAGTVIAAVGVIGAFLISAGGLFLGVVVLGTIPILGKTLGGSKTSPLRDAREGFSYVLKHPPVLFALIACSMAIFNGSLNVMRPVFARDVLDVGSVGYGIMGASSGVGTVVGALAASMLPPFKRPGLAIAFAMFAYGACLFLYSFAFSFRYVLVIEFCSGLAGQLWNISTYSGLQMAVPEHMRGRIVSMVFMCIQLSFVGQLIIGVLADRFGDQIALRTFGLLPMSILAVTMLVGYRHLKQL